MKAILITYNQTLTEKVDYMLARLGIKGYTMFHETTGAGTNTGTPHLGTHTWPEINNAVFTVVDDDMVDRVFVMIKKMDGINETVGIRAFVWEIQQTY